MTIDCLPKIILKQMNNLMARFFWGKTNQARYMAPAAWKNICKPIEDGGLGVRDIYQFGEAIFMKLVWAMAAEKEKLWVQVCKAKIFFQNSVKWKLGDATSVTVLGQPWFDGWNDQQVASHTYRKMTVSELFQVQSQQWRVPLLSTIFNQNQVNAILQLGPILPVGNYTQDKLIYRETKSEKYTVRDGYKIMTSLEGHQQVNQVATLWKKIHSWQGVAPKVKVFLWRLISKALMLSNNVHRRIARVSPMCQRCNTENEYEMHCFFYCQGSRVVWFGSNLELKTQDLPLNVATTVQQCTDNMSEEGIRRFCYTLWEIWMARNDLVMQQKSFDPV
ncbi:hypothetical protein LUZ61_008497 [Rhynchospora tenuis]|uniref:Reverse transcriptase zinc-binding domain-containing protein n=1 Tax=Rhynchospora tenuis TaxID=198213 RepID=A0AAD5ZVG0_9POAL|nr:hypothetical protein LUZ61_008497 [Rhynchospora tenuis]